MKNHKALLIVNLGTPDKPQKKEVRKYLTEFLNDRRVIDIPWLLQKILVNLIIIPFRLKNSTRLYKRLWTEKGSPLLVYLDNLSEKLKDRINDKYRVYKAMRYGKPNLKNTLREIKNNNIEELVLFPLFPQYASSTNGSIIEKVFKEINTWEAIPGIKVIGQFYNHPDFINAFAGLISKYDPMNYDHIIFSYHGLPERHLNKIHPGHNCSDCQCVNGLPEHGKLCYKAACYETTRLLTEKLNIPKEKFSVGFQSRLSKNWLSPFTDKLITDLAKKGAKKILVTAPSFVADCLETIVEIEYEYDILFKENGGEKLTLVKSLNDTDLWADAIVKIVD